MSSKKSFGFSSFQLPAKPKRVNNAIPPPPSSGVSKQGYSTMNAISQNALAAQWGMPRKRAKTEEEYFDEDDDDGMSSTPALAYIPAPGSPTSTPAEPQREDSDEDPLDAFMARIEQQVQIESVAPTSAGTGGIRGDIEEEDVEESYYRYMEENPNAGLQDDGSDVEIEYDQDGNPIVKITKKIIDPLPPMDHSEINYEPFEKNFYTIHEDIAALDKDKVIELRNTLGLKVSLSRLFS